MSWPASTSAMILTAPPVAASPPASAGAAETLASEAHALMELLSFSAAGTLALWFVIAIAVVSVTERLIQRARAVGLDPTRQAAGVRLLVRGVIVALLAVASLRELIEVAPVITAVAAGVTAAVATLSLLRRLPGLVSGYGLALSGKLREGDDISVEGGPTGRVERLGPFETQLRRSDGALVTVATHRLAAKAVAILTRDAPRELTLRLPWPPEDGQSAVDKMRVQAWLCPYRAVDTDVSVNADESGMTVSLKVWTGAERLAEAYLVRRD